MVDKINEPTERILATMVETIVLNTPVASSTPPSAVAIIISPIVLSIELMPPLDSNESISSIPLPEM